MKHRLSESGRLTFDWNAFLLSHLQRVLLVTTSICITVTNERYPRGLQISLHIRSPRLQDYDKGEGVFRSKLWSSQIWSFLKWGRVFRSKLWSSQIWSFPKWGGGGFLVWNSRKGLSGEFGQKFTVQPETCLCITDSLLHTTYVETNNVLLSEKNLFDIYW